MMAEKLDSHQWKSTTLRVNVIPRHASIEKRVIFTLNFWSPQPLRVSLRVSEWNEWSSIVGPLMDNLI